MKVVTFLGAHALRRVRLRKPPYVPDVVRMFKEQFGFVKVPSSDTEMLPEEGSPLEFSHGKIVVDGREVIIASMHLYSHMFDIDAVDSTDNADIVMEEILKLHGDLVEAVDSRKHYVSQLEMDSDAPMELASPIIGAMMTRSSQFLTSYDPNIPPGSHAPGMRFSGISLNLDPTGFVLPCDFRIERRTGIPYERNLYFSQAPFRTADHISALSDVDGVVKALLPGGA